MVNGRNEDLFKLGFHPHKDLIKSDPPEELRATGNSEDRMLHGLSALCFLYCTINVSLSKVGTILIYVPRPSLLPIVVTKYYRHGS